MINKMIRKIFSDKIRAVAAAAVFTAGIAAFVLSFAQMSYAAGASPGSAGDPLASQSYVDQKIQDLQNQILSNPSQSGVPSSITGLSQAAEDQIIADLLAKLDNVIGSGNLSSGQTPADNGYTAVFLPQGETLFGGDGTEIMLRSGSAVAVIPSINGFADATGGVDIQDGESIPMNHLLIVPRGDGRGVKATAATAETWFLVRGSYTIQK